MKLRSLLAGAAALLAGLSVPAAAWAADAIATANVNKRAGPGTQFEALAVVPAGARVTVHACTAGFAWCDASSAQGRGWVSGRFLRHAERGALLPQVGAAAGIAVVAVGGRAPARHAAPIQGLTLPDLQIEPEPGERLGLFDQSVTDPQVTRRDVIRHAAPIHEERVRDDAALFGVLVPLGRLP
jgi:uncharacterized protein YraI